MTIAKALKHQISLWGLFAVTLTLLVSFFVWAPYVGGQILDSAATPEEVISLLDGMGDSQRRSHFWMTLLLDMPFPMAYGALMTGVIWKFFGRRGFWIAFPVYACVFIDLAENMVQLTILSGHNDLLAHKAYLTPLKRLFFLASVSAAVYALGIGLVSRLMRPKSQTDINNAQS